ncbi:MAG: pyridoxal-phosphate dependent enzyme [Vampirovibrionales bacterium]|nr:pyridoxal-phosphate dependent enzyme [Vampirovibrionales bacterium]
MSRLYHQTPLIESLALTRRWQRPVWLKLEALQPSGSFKLRGIGLFCQQQVLNHGARGFVASSGGNAGLAVAYAARHLGVPATIFVPEQTREVFLSRLNLEGATVIKAGRVWDETHAAALAFCDHANGNNNHGQGEQGLI